MLLKFRGNYEAWLNGVDVPGKFRFCDAAAITLERECGFVRFHLHIHVVDEHEWMNEWMNGDVVVGQRVKWEGGDSWLVVMETHQLALKMPASFTGCSMLMPSAEWFPSGLGQCKPRVPLLWAKLRWQKLCVCVKYEFLSHLERDSFPSGHDFHCTLEMPHREKV